MNCLFEIFWMCTMVSWHKNNYLNVLCFFWVNQKYKQESTKLYKVAQWPAHGLLIPLDFFFF